MKIVHFIGTFNFGGIEKLVFDLAKKQDDVGNEVCIAVAKNEGDFKKMYNYQRFDIKILNIKSGYNINLFKFIEIKNFIKKFDVIHLHGFHLLIALVCLFSKKKIVYTEHGNFGFARKIKTKDKINFFLRSTFFKLAKLEICANSNFTKEYIERFFYKGKKLKIVFNGINLHQNINNDLLNRLNKEFNNFFIIGTTSRLVEVKNLELLLDIFNKFSRNHSNTKLVIVGEGHLKEKLTQKVEVLNLIDLVCFEGFQSEITTYQSIFDVCVFPSMNESFGLSALECLNLNKPVLVFKNGGGLTEIVSKFNKHDICDNEKQMLQRLSYYYENNVKIVNDIEQLKFFSVERMANDYMNVYLKK